MSHIVIVGAGQAAGQAAASLRQGGFEGGITVVGDEAHAPYQRPPLSKQYLAGELDVENVLLRPKSFYEGKDIDLKTGVRVTAIDRVVQTVNMDNGETLSYDQLLLATGGRPRELTIPGRDLAGIHYLRSIADVDAIRAEMDTAKNMVIVGGGYIGLEVASVAIKAGINVTVVEMEDRILKRVTTPTMSEFYHNLHIERGVQIELNTSIDGFSGDTKVSGVNCGDTTFDTDLVIVGIGILPNAELAEAAGLEVDNGIIVDDHCRTSDPNIYAAGDCTNHPNPTLNRRLRLESVPNAMEQSRIAVTNMTGGDKVYDAVPWFWSDQYELKLQMVGFSTDGDTEVLRGDKSANEFAVFYMKGDTLVAADAINSPREFMVCKQLYGKQVDPTKLADPGVDLKDLR